MNADDRHATTGHGLYTPRSPEAAETATPARRAFMPVGVPSETAAPQAAAAPVSQSAPAAPAVQAPTSTGSIPQRTPMRPTTASGGIPTTSRGAAPTAPVSQPSPVTQPRAQQPGAAPAASAPSAAPAFAPTHAPARPAAPADQPAPQFGTGGTQQPASDTSSVLGAGTAKLKGFAVRAAESFKEGDDLSTPASKGGPRRARVLVSRIDPWSALKLGFLMSIAIGIMFVVAVFVMWNVLNEMGTFALINQWVVDLFTPSSEIDIMQFFDQNKVMSAAILLSVVNVVLLTALSTIAAFLYNVISSVVGGFYVTLTDD